MNEEEEEEKGTCETKKNFNFNLFQREKKKLPNLTFFIGVHI